MPKQWESTQKVVQAEKLDWTLKELEINAYEVVSVVPHQWAVLDWTMAAGGQQPQTFRVTHYLIVAKRPQS